ncbi:hypothetical protein Lal_00000654 [Lupinus albus]|nr:hypothetical protein Lal_00000654 [Lupinus albus]
MEVGGSSLAVGGIIAANRDPYYSPTLLATKLDKSQGRKLTYIRYADISWLVEHGFEFPHQLELQGANAFLEMEGEIYPSLVREFYRVYMSLVSGKIITLDQQLFLDVGGLPSLRYLYGRFQNTLWNAFEFVKLVYKSCMRGSQNYVSGQKPKATSFSFENRLMHLFITYILFPRDDNYDEPTTHDLQVMFAIKEGLTVNWRLEILKVMSSTASSSSKSLGYGMFLSRVFEHLNIDTYGVEVIDIEPREHLVIGHLIHSLCICNYVGIWEYLEDINFEIVCDQSSNKETEYECGVNWTEFLAMMARETDKDAMEKLEVNNKSTNNISRLKEVWELLGNSRLSEKSSPKRETQSCSQAFSGNLARAKGNSLKREKGEEERLGELCNLRVKEKIGEEEVWELLGDSRPSEGLRVALRHFLGFSPERKGTRLSERKGVEAGRISPGRDNVA